MSRPTTRSKNKRQRQVENDDTTAEILRKIHLTGEITDDDVNQLYMITKPVCQGCRVNTKDNPNCFCGLTPPPNGSRKTGLWQKMSDIIQALGPDPCKDLRASAHSPAGLTNLGATCYANSILQPVHEQIISTRCSKCGKDSDASSNMEDFYVLELNVKGLKTLDESLTDYLSVEELHGDNQYFFESCNTRVDASRSIKLRTLPDVLNFQLKRYDFIQKLRHVDQLLFVALEKIFSGRNGFGLDWLPQKLKHFYGNYITKN